MRILIDPDAHLYATTHDLDGGDEATTEKLARLFGLAWRRLPEKDRQEILGYWEEIRKDPEMPEGIIYPLIDSAPYSEGSFGVSLNKGRGIRIAPSAVREAPEEACLFLIAHELAHVYQHALDKKGELGIWEGEEEQHANAVAETRWKFTGVYELRRFIANRY